MALQVAASIYGINGNALGTSNNGQAWSFPSQGFISRPAPASTTFNGVTCNAIIQVLPSGLTVDANQYYTDLTTAQLVTAANA